MPERDPVQLWISPTQKSEWQNYVAESDRIESLSSLIRHSVSSYIAEDSTGSNKLDNIDNFLESIDEINTDIRQIKDSIRLARLDIPTDEDIYELTQAATEEELEIWTEKQTEEILNRMENI